jgi:fatty-acyl-CoA synthase
MQDQGLGSWPRRRARIAPGDVALVYEGRRWTYGELADRVDELGAALRDRGIGPGDRVAYLGPNHPGFVETMFASLALGAIFVPLNTRLAPVELSYVMRDAGARALVWDHRLDETARKVLAEAPAELRVVVGGTRWRSCGPASGRARARCRCSATTSP